MKFISIKNFRLVSQKISIKNKKKYILLSIFLGNASIISEIILFSFFTNFIENEEIQIFNIDFSDKYVYFLIFLFAILRFLFFVSDLHLREILSIKINRYLKNLTFDNLFESWFVNNKFAYQLNVESEKIGDLYKDYIAFSVSLIQGIGILAFLFITDLQTLKLFIILGFFISIPLSISKKIADKFMQDYQDTYSSLNERILDISKNIFLVKILNNRKLESEIFKKELEKFEKSFRNISFYGIFNYHLPNFVAIIGILVIIIFLNNRIQINLLSIFVGLRLFQLLGNSLKAYFQILEKNPFVEQFLNLNLLVRGEKKVVGIKDKNNSIELANIDFSYNSKTIIFEDLNYNFKLNKHYVVTGNNGTGKSTLLGLIAGILNVENGTTALSSEEIGYVGSTPYIFELNLKSNILYGIQNKKISDDEIIYLVKKLDLFKNNWDLYEIISKESLSTGQMQKIAFIRIILQKPKIILLDESTSNLDKKTRNLIFNLLAELNATIINVTHDEQNFLNVDYYLKISNNKLIDYEP